MKAQVWYCQNRRCRRAVKVEPRYLKTTWTMCSCKHPMPSIAPTTVYWDEAATR